MGLDEQLRIVDEMNREVRIELAEGEGSLHFLQKVYRSPSQPLSVRLRAAIEALPFEMPKLTAVATTTINGQDFAAMLDKAIERSARAHQAKQIEGPAQIEGTCEEVPMRRR